MREVIGYQQRNWVMKFLMGLNNYYKGPKAQILLIKPFPSLNEVYSIIQKKEKHKDISADISNLEAIALMVREPNKLLQPVTANKAKYYCSHYNISRHSFEHCFKANPHKSGCTHSIFRVILVKFTTNCMVIRRDIKFIIKPGL